MSYSVGHYRFATDGFRDNNDLDERSANAFLQYRPSHDTNLQAELRSSRMEHGDLTTFFDRDLYSDSLRGSEDADSLRLGAKHQLTPKSHNSRFVDRAGRAVEQFQPRPFSLYRKMNKAYSVDVQDIARIGDAIVQTGFVSAEQDEAVASTVFVPDVGPRRGDYRRHEPATRAL